MQDFQGMQELNDQDLETVVGGASPFTTANVNVGSSFLPGGPSTYGSVTATATEGQHVNLTYGHTQSITVSNVDGPSFSFANGFAFAIAY
jgi:hypothetical protein